MLTFIIISIRSSFRLIVLNLPSDILNALLIKASFFWPAHMWLVVDIVDAKEYMWYCTSINAQDKSICGVCVCFWSCGINCELCGWWWWWGGAVGRRQAVNSALHIGQQSAQHTHSTDPHPFPSPQWAPKCAFAVVEDRSCDLGMYWLYILVWKFVLAFIGVNVV